MKCSASKIPIREKINRQVSPPTHVGEVAVCARSEIMAYSCNNKTVCPHQLNAHFDKTQTSIKQKSLRIPRGARMKSAACLPSSSYFEEKKTDHVSIILNFRVEEYLIDISPIPKVTATCSILDTFPKNALIRKYLEYRRYSKILLSQICYLPQPCLTYSSSKSSHH